MSASNITLCAKDIENMYNDINNEEKYIGLLYSGYRMGTLLKHDDTNSLTDDIKKSEFEKTIDERTKLIESYKNDMIVLVDKFMNEYKKVNTEEETKLFTNIQKHKDYSSSTKKYIKDDYIFACYKLVLFYLKSL